MRLLATLVFICSIAGLSGCEDSKEANLYKAQICLDNATTAAAAEACTAIIANNNSERANVIKCSASFVKNGIDEAAMAQAVDEISGEGGGDPTAPALATLTMENTDESAEAVSFCTASGSLGLLRLAQFADMATTMTTGLLGLTPPLTAASVEAAIDGYNPSSPSTEDKEDLGNTVLASQNTLCNPTDGMFKNDEVCTDINAAIEANPNDPEAIADALLNNLDNE